MENKRRNLTWFEKCCCLLNDSNFNFVSSLFHYILWQGKVKTINLLKIMEKGILFFCFSKASAFFVLPINAWNKTKTKSNKKSNKNNKKNANNYIFWHFDVLGYRQCNFSSVPSLKRNVETILVAFKVFKICLQFQPS